MTRSALSLNLDDDDPSLQRMNSKRPKWGPPTISLSRTPAAV